MATGPGPFTGLRVGVTTAKALAWTNGCSLVGVSTASCLATQAVAECGSCDQVEVIFDAGRGELYVATACQPEDNLIWQISEGTVWKPADWRKTLAPGSLVTGPGLAMQHDVIQELNDNPGTLKLPPAPAWHPYVRTLSCIGLAAVEKGITSPPGELAPTYFRASYAEDRSRT